MKGFCLVILVLFFIGMTVYAQESGWRENGSNVTLRQSGDNVGIGITPEEKLHINGSIRGNQKNGALRIKTSRGYLDIGSQSSSWCHMMTDRSMFYFNKEIRVSSGKIGTYKFHDLQLRTGGTTRIRVDKDNGNVGIGTDDPDGKLHVNGDVVIGAEPYTQYRQRLNVNGDGLCLWKKIGAAVNAATISINDNGHTTIKANPRLILSSNEVAVTTKLSAKRIDVTVDGLPDYVFADDYELMPLSELEEVIKKEKSLPGIPTEKEAVENGLNIGEMQGKLLEKVEELTLYVIQQNTRLDELQKENEELKNIIYSLKTK